MPCLIFLSQKTVYHIIQKNRLLQKLLSQGVRPTLTSQVLRLNQESTEFFRVIIHSFELFSLKLLRQSLVQQGFFHGNLGIIIIFLLFQLFTHRQITMLEIIWTEMYTYLEFHILRAPKKRKLKIYFLLSSNPFKFSRKENN